jgi:hypothetical protein
MVTSNLGLNTQQGRESKEGPPKYETDVQLLQSVYVR